MAYFWNGRGVLKVAKGKKGSGANVVPETEKYLKKGDEILKDDLTQGRLKKFIEQGLITEDAPKKIAELPKDEKKKDADGE